MAELNDLPKTKAIEHYPKEGPLKSVKIVFEGYWGRFEKAQDGAKKVVLRGKGETLNSRAFNVSIPSAIYQRMYKRALVEFGIVTRKLASNALPASKPESVEFIDPQPVPVPVFAPRLAQGRLF